MADEYIEVTKYGESTPVRIDSATMGGISDITITKVLNDAGSLVLALQATTPAMLSSWLSEAALVQYFSDGRARGYYMVDDYTPKWSDCSATVNCVGILAATKQVLYTGTFSNWTAADAILELVTAVSDYGIAGKYSDAVVSSAFVGVSDTGTNSSTAIANQTYTDKCVFDALAEICSMVGLAFSISGGLFSTVDLPTTPSKTYTLGVDCWDFETTYTARDIVNELVLVSEKGTWRYTDTDSQSTYGRRAQKLQVSGIASYAAGKQWAAAAFRRVASPQRQMILRVGYDPDIEPGQMVSVVGLEDGRTYQDVIQQVTYTVGDNDMELQVGAQAETLSGSSLVNSGMSIGSSAGSLGPSDGGAASVGAVTDGFDRADGALADPWVYALRTGAITSVSVESDELVVRTGATSSFALVAYDSDGGARKEMRTDCQINPAPYSTSGVAVRCSAATGECYLASPGSSESNNLPGYTFGTVYLNRLDSSGASTMLAYSDIQAALGRLGTWSDAVSLQVEDTDTGAPKLTVFVAGITILSYIDTSGSAITRSGYSGVTVFGSYSSAQESQFDNFSAEPV